MFDWATVSDGLEHLRELNRLERETKNYKDKAYTYENDIFTLIDSIVIYEGFRQAWNFYMSPIEDYAIFADRQEDGFGDIDLYISFKTKENNWGYPINMGPDINTELRERFPTVSPR